MSWLYLTVELTIIFSLGFLHVYFKVMRQVGMTWTNERTL